MGSILTTILQTLTSGIATFAQGLGQGLKALVENIFLEVSTVEGVTSYALSSFGYLVVIFGAVALTIGLSRYIVMIVTSFGARK